MTSNSASRTGKGSSHYERLADSYDATWAHRPDYVSWMNDHITDRLELTPTSRVADVGAGTGLFLRELAGKVDSEHPVICIDPSQAMLDRVPDDPRLQTLQATAEQVADRSVALPYPDLDALVVKEAVHHFTDLPHTLQGLAGLMSPGGRLLIVTLPPTLDYPLFTAALERFAANQPEPATIADYLSEAGLRVALQYEEFPVSVDRDRYISLVGNRWMSVLSTFDDDELDKGLDQMRREHPEQTLRFTERFAFILGFQA